MTDTKVINAEGTNKTVPAVKTKQGEVRELLATYKDQIQMALPKHLSADQFIRVALTSISKTPRLLDCTISSLMGALLQSAQLGLSPDGILGEAYLIPFRNNKTNKMEVQFIPGYRGLVSLAQRSGQLKSFQAREVYEADEFDYEFGLNEKLVHIPAKNVTRGTLTYVYAVAHFTNGGYVFEVMSREEVEFIRDTQSKQPNGQAWLKSFPEMAKKTVIRKLSKLLPLSPEFNKAVALEDSFEFSGSQKNDRELLNYKFEDSIVHEVEDNIQTDSEIEEAEIVQEKKDEKTAKIDNAMKNALKKVNPKKVAEDESKEVSYITDITNRLFAAKTPIDKEEVLNEIANSTVLTVGQKEDLLKLNEGSGK